MPKTIGVTGGAGFIGAYVCEELLARGYKVVSLDHSARETTQGVELFLADVRDRTAMIEFAAHVDAVIHLAAVLGTQETIGNPMPAAETNILGGVNVLDGCRQYNLPLVYAGVGNYWMRNTYSTTKTTIENLAYQYRDEFSCKFAVVRPVNAYGPRQRVASPFGPGKVRKIVPAFVCRALSGMPIEIYGDGSQISDMVHVKDVAGVFVDTLEILFADRVPSNPIEVGPAKSCTVRQVAEEVTVIASKLLGVDGPDIRFLPMRPGEKTSFDVNREILASYTESARSFFDETDAQIVSRTLRTLGSVVRADTSTLAQIGRNADSFTSLTQGLQETVTWYYKNRGSAWTLPRLETP